MSQSLKHLINDLTVRMGELGIVEGTEVTTLQKLEKLLSARPDYELAEVKVSARDRRFVKDDIKGMILMRNMGVSAAKIGEKYGCAGMMVLNICSGKIYKDLLEELASEGIKISR